MAGMGAAFASGSAAVAEMQLDLGVTDPAGLFTETTLVDIGVGTSLSGFDAPAGFDALDGYPSSIPSGSTSHFVSYAGTLAIEDPVTGRGAFSYCIDLNTDTEVGVHYHHGEWSEANVPNLGYIEYILLNYFPTTPEPASAASDAQRAAAVQAAIWFFSDNFILDTATTTGSITAAIVDDAIANGPADEPSAPELSVSPTEMPAPDTGEIVGPFTVTADGPSTIRLAGVEVFHDSDGAVPLAEGDTVAPGSQLWARSVSDLEPQGFVLDLVAEHLVGTVYLFDESNPGREEAQTLVLAQNAEMVARAGTELIPYAAGGLEVTKRISGPGAGLQGEIVMEVSCEDQAGGIDRQYVLTVVAGSPAGDHPQSVVGIPAGSQCVITEITDGANDQVRAAESVIEPVSVIITAGETQIATVLNTYVLCDQPPGDTDWNSTDTDSCGYTPGNPETRDRLTATGAQDLLAPLGLAGLAVAVIGAAAIIVAIRLRRKAARPRCSTEW
jgi:hypothetical protein